jgi:hypothetical protein
MKTLRQISKGIGITEQRLHYWVSMKDAPKPVDIKRKKVSWVKYYNQEAVLDYCNKANPAIFDKELISIRQAEKILNVPMNKIVRRLKKPNAPICKSKGYRHLYDKKELLTWWNELK